MGVTGGLMAMRVRNSPLRYLRAYGDCILRDLMPAFNGIERRARQAGDDEYRRLGTEPAGDDWDGDMGVLADAAEDHAIALYETLSAMRQSMLNLFAVGLFHLLKQQVADLCHDGAFMVPRLEGTQLIGEVSQWYLQHFQLDLRGIPSWAAIDQLRVVANVVKHAEGDSAARLRERRPELFCYPALQEAQLGIFNIAGHVARPLAGDDLYVTPQALQEYIDAAISFVSAIEAHFQEHRDEHYPR